MTLKLNLMENTLICLLCLLQAARPPKVYRRNIVTGPRTRGQGRSYPGTRGEASLKNNSPPLSPDEIGPLAFKIVIRKRKIIKIKS